MKETRRNFSHAVTNGRRSGSGKIVYEFYDDQAKFWGGSAAAAPLSSGVDTDVISPDREKIRPSETCKTSSNGKRANESLDDLDMYDCDSNQGLESEYDIETEAGKVVEAQELPKKRKRAMSPDEVPKLTDEKRKHL